MIVSHEMYHVLSLNHIRWPVRTLLLGSSCITVAAGANTSFPAGRSYLGIFWFRKRKTTDNVKENEIEQMVVYLTVIPRFLRNSDIHFLKSIVQRYSIQNKMY